jgi:hypothetical protein
MELQRITVQGQPRETFSRDKILIKQVEHVVQNYNPCYAGGVGKRIAFQGQVQAKTRGSVI